MTNDLISDMLTRMRNASRAKHSFVRVRYSKINIAILQAFLDESYIESFRIIETKNFPRWIQIILKYKGWWVKKPFFSILARVSKPGQRIFSSYQDFGKKLNALKYNQGVAIISTSMGVISHSTAIQFKKGGEILCYIE